jgi:CHAT domain-containing protein/tetratricopeptide (TPR) repeat protein
LVFLIAALTGMGEHNSAAFAQVEAPDAKAALKERDRLSEQTKKLQAAGKLSEAITSARAMLAIERMLLPAGHDDVLGSLEWLARMYIQRGDFAEATAARQEALDALRKRLGEKHWKVTDARLALDDVKLQASLTREQRDRLAESNRLNQDMVKFYRAGKCSEAAQVARRALAIRKELLGERHADYATSLNDVAVLLQSQGDYAAARPLVEQALAIYKEVLGERHPAYASGLNNLAALLQLQGDYAGARPLVERALVIRKEVLGEHHPDYATSLNNLAALLQSQGDHAGARPLFERALAITKELLGERHRDYTQSLNNLAVLLTSQGDYARARPLFEQALAINKEVLREHHPDYAVGLNRLADLLQSQGDYAGARPLFERALAIKKEVLGERHPDYANSLNNLAFLLESQGDYAGARPLYERVLAIRKDVLGERHPDYANSLNNLAFLLESQGDFAGARPLYERALAIYKEVLGERHPDYAISLNNLAHMLHSQGDYAGARPLYERALAIVKEVLGESHPDYATSLNNLAALLRAQGDDAGAHPLFERALAIRKEVLGERHPQYADSLSTLGSLAWARNDVAAAEPLLRKALEVAEGNLDLAAAGQSERQQLAMARDLRGALDSYLSFSPFGKLVAADVYRHVLVAKGAVLERQRRLRMQQRQKPASPGSQAARRFEEYTQTVTKLSAMALGGPDALQRDQWKSRLEELSRRKDELEAELSRLDTSFRAAQSVATRTPEQLQASLPDKATALVDYLVYWASEPPAQGNGKFRWERRALAFVIRPGRPIARIELGPLAAIQNATDGWRRLLIHRDPAPAVIDAGTALRRLIWEPVEPSLEGITSVLISPDGPIGLVPLAALPGKDPSHYLIEERSIAVVPVPRMQGSAAIAVAPDQGATEALPPSLLLAGDITYGGAPGTASERAVRRSAAIDTRAGVLADFKELSSSRGEVLEVRDSFEERFPDGRAQLLRGDSATEEAIRQNAPKSRYLHLATHGYFAPPALRSALAPEDPKVARPGIDILGGAGVAGYHPGLLSGIALAGANVRPTPDGQDDGILTALEVAELDLSGVELAVLSACETGLGEVAGGEGLLGLQRAFQVAGAQSVIASLWRVGDEPTRALMARFYENLWRKNRTPAQALRDAQLSMLRGDLGRGTLTRETEKSKPGRLPPYYWAGFVLSTDRP